MKMMSQQPFMDHAAWKAEAIPTSLSFMGAGDVDLWRIDLGKDSASLSSEFDLLSAEEKTRANKFVFPKDRVNFITGRAALRKIIGGYLQVSPDEVEISARHYGKPFVSTESCGLQFNVSHSHEVAVIAISRGREVGVDLEFVDQSFDVRGVAPSVFSTEEVSRINSLAADQQVGAFFTGWTRKEALLKALGDGLSTSDELQAAVSQLRHDEALFRYMENGTSREWTLISFAIDEQFKAALAIEGELGTIRFLAYSEDHAPVNMLEAFASV